MVIPGAPAGPLTRAGGSTTSGEGCARILRACRAKARTATLRKAGLPRPGAATQARRAGLARSAPARRSHGAQTSSAQSGPQRRVGRVLVAGDEHRAAQRDGGGDELVVVC